MKGKGSGSCLSEGLSKKESFTPPKTKENSNGRPVHDNSMIKRKSVKK